MSEEIQVEHWQQNGKMQSLKSWRTHRGCIEAATQRVSGTAAAILVLKQQKTRHKSGARHATISMRGSVSVWHVNISPIKASQRNSAAI